MNIKQDFTQLKEILNENPRDLKYIKGKEKEYLEAVMIDKYAKQDVVRMFLDDMDRKIKAIDGLLLNMKEMTVDERRRYFDKRDVYKEVIKFFKPSEKRIKMIEESMSREVSELKRRGF